MFWYDKRQKRKKERRSVTKTMEIYHILLKGGACLFVLAGMSES